MPKKREREVERKFVKLWEERHGETAIKFADLNRNGGPDRMILLPEGHVVFLEFKRPGKKGDVRPDQREYHTLLHEAGHIVEVFDNGEAAFDYCDNVFDYLARVSGQDHV
jgi:hypothetical protein